MAARPLEFDTGERNTPCVRPGCGQRSIHAIHRGLCPLCYTDVANLVRRGVTTWQGLEMAGKTKPIDWKPWEEEQGTSSEDFRPRNDIEAWAVGVQDEASRLPQVRSSVRDQVEAATRFSAPPPEEDERAPRSEQAPPPPPQRPIDAKLLKKIMKDPDRFLPVEAFDHMVRTWQEEDEAEDHEITVPPTDSPAGGSDQPSASLHAGAGGHIRGSPAAAPLKETGAETPQEVPSDVPPASAPLSDEDQEGASERDPPF